MVAPVRVLPDSNTSNELLNQHTRPFRLVVLTVSGTSYYYSEGPAFTDSGGNSYISGRVRVSDFSWDAGAVQSGTVEILENGTEIENLVLSNGFAEATISVYQVYYQAAGTFTTPVLYISGVCDGASYTPISVILTVVTTSLNTQFIPNFYITQANGFNWLTPDGTIFYFNGVSYKVLSEQD